MLSQSGLQLTGKDPPQPARAGPRAAMENAPHAAKKARLLACVDQSSIARSVATHAAAIANSLGLEMTLARVIDDGGPMAPPVDPIDWQMRRQEHRAQLSALVDGVGGEKQASGVLLTGEPADELIDWCKANGTTLLALAMRNDPGPHGIGSTALRILQDGSVSLFLVPPFADHALRYRRILIPLDGSQRAESVIPVARRIARDHGAELVLVHVVPPLRSGAAFQAPHLSALHSEVERQHSRGAREHLERLCQRAHESGLQVRSVMLGPADPRRTVCQFARDQQIDLVVMSSHGATALGDVPCGSVAEYLASHCNMPVLMVRPSLVTGFAGDGCDKDGQSVFHFG